MKRILFTVASTVTLLGAVVPTLYAQTLPQTTPFEIVNLAQNGYFKEQGIPGQNRLIAAYQSGQLSAEDLIKAAVEENRISEDAIKDTGFVNAVTNYLDGLSDR